MIRLCLAASSVVAFVVACRADDDPFRAYLDGTPPPILRDVSPVLDAPPRPPKPGEASSPAAPAAPPQPVAVPGVALRGIVFQGKTPPGPDGAPRSDEIYAVIARPEAPGTYPGILMLHGGTECVQPARAAAWARRGYIVVAPELPGIAEPARTPNSKGPWFSQKYGESFWKADPDATASSLFTSTVTAMQALSLLRSLPGVDPARIGVVGCSWGGYTATMVCALAGDAVKAGFSIYGCGFYDRLPYTQPILARMPEAERARWLESLDAGRRAGAIRARFFLAGAANDFFFAPPGVQATLDAIPGEKNHLYAPASNHHLLVPGGTPPGDNWPAMALPYFDYQLKGEGQAFPIVTAAAPGPDPLEARFAVTAPVPATAATVWWSAADRAWADRQWAAVPAALQPDGTYLARLPEPPPSGEDWFAVVSDARPVSVSGDLGHLPGKAVP